MAYSLRILKRHLQRARHRNGVPGSLRSIVTDHLRPTRTPAVIAIAPTSAQDDAGIFAQFLGDARIAISLFGAERPPSPVTTALHRRCTHDDLMI